MQTADAPGTSPQHKNLRGGWPFIVRKISGHSMVPVLPPNTLIVGFKKFRNLQINDVVIFVHNDREKIKRITDMRDNEVYVLGDLADESTDSRHFGWIPQEHIVAKVVIPRDVSPAEQH